MVQAASDKKNRRLSARRRPRRASKVACFRGSLGLGPNLALEMLDISDRGVRMRVKEAFDLHQEMEVHLTGLAHRKPVKVLAEVVWCVPAADGSFCIGAHFHRGLPYADLQQLT